MAEAENSTVKISSRTALSLASDMENDTRAIQNYGQICLGLEEVTDMELVGALSQVGLAITHHANQIEEHRKKLFHHLHALHYGAGKGADDE